MENQDLHRLYGDYAMVDHGLFDSPAAAIHVVEDHDVEVFYCIAVNCKKCSERQKRQDERRTGFKVAYR